MKFFWPAPLDLIDPSFNFLKDKGNYGTASQQHQLFPHEYFKSSPYHGFVISKIYLDKGSNCRWNSSQLNRFYREGAKRFLRFPLDSSLEIMGDSGAYTKASYDQGNAHLIDECLEVINFYNSIGVDYGLSPDNVISGYLDITNSNNQRSVPKEWHERWERTIQLAETFFLLHKKKMMKWIPLGVAQGWDPISYRESVKMLQQIGYKYIALGGLNSLPSTEIFRTLKACETIKYDTTNFHLLGVSRIDHLKLFKENGVISFDSSMPIRQAINDDKNNYHSFVRNYLAIRVPQSSASPKLKRLVTAGKLDFKELRNIELLTLKILRKFDSGTASLQDVLDLLKRGEKYRGEKDYSHDYRKTLQEKPWKECPCPICKEIGIEVIIHRNRERNLRRGFHNLFVFSKKLKKASSLAL